MSLLSVFLVAALPVLTQTVKDGQPAVLCRVNGKPDVRAAAKARNVTLAEGPLGGRTAFRLGSDGTAVIPLPPQQVGETGGTILFWLKPARMPVGTGFNSIDNHTDTNGVYRPMGGEHGRLRVLGFRADREADVLLTGSYAVLPGTTELKLAKNVFAGTWACFACSWGPTKAETFAFTDGVVRPGAMCHGWGRTKPLELKELALGSVRGHHPGFAGDIAFLKVWNRRLTPEEIRAEYAKVQPVALELEDYAVEAGRPSRLRLRVFNFTNRALTRAIRLTVGGRDYVQTTSLTPHGQADLTYEVTLEKPGVFRLDTSENRTFEIAAVDMGRSVTRAMKSGGEVNWRLVETFDATKGHPAEKMLADGTHVVRKPALAYRESAPSARAAWCWRPERLAHPDRWHVLEVDYPDDARRQFSVHAFSVNPRTGGMTGGQMESIGIMTGGLHPNTYRPQRRRLMFRPESTRIEVIVETSPFAHAFSKGSAVSAFRIYEADVDLLPSLGTFGGDRTSGVWDEDPTMDCEWFARAHFKPTLDLDFWRLKAERIVEYARFMGHNRWTVQVMDYQGDRNGSVLSLPASITRGYHGHVDGWVDLYAKVFAREGLPWYGRLGKAYDGRGFYESLLGKSEADRLRMLPGDGTDVGAFQQLDPALPETVAALRRIVVHYRDKYADSPTFLGLSFDSHNLLHYFGPNYGYGDATVARFAQEAGLRLDDVPRTNRVAYLLDGDRALAEKWVAWRCRKVADCARALAEELRRGNDRLVLKAYVFPSQMYYGSRLAEWDIEREQRRRGLDFAALNRIPGFEVIPYDSPDEEVSHTFNRWGGGTLLLGRQTYSPKTLNWIAAREKTPSVNFVAHANLESFSSSKAALPECHYPLSYSAWDAAAKTNGAFASWASCFPNADEALMPWTSWLAYADVKEIQFGFWGMPEMGLQERFREFYRAYRSIPKGDYRLVNDPTDPVAVRASGEDWFMVNKESFPVTVNGETVGPCAVIVRRGNRPATFLQTWDPKALDPYRRVVSALQAADLPCKGTFASALDAHDFAAVRRLLLTPEVFEVIKDMKPFAAEARWRADDRTIEVTLRSDTPGRHGHVVSLESASDVWAGGTDASGRPERVEVGLAGGDVKKVLLHPSRFPTRDGEAGLVTVVVTRDDRHVERFDFLLGGAFAYYDPDKATVGDDWSFSRYRLRPFHADPPDPNRLGLAFDYRIGYLWNARGLFVAVEVDETDADVVLPQPGKGYAFAPIRSDSLQYFFSCRGGATYDRQGFGDEDIECFFYQPEKGDYFGSITRFSKYARWHQPIASARHRRGGQTTQYEFHIPAEQFAGVRMGEGTVITACHLINNRFARKDLWLRLGTSQKVFPYARPGTWPTLTFVKDMNEKESK